MQGLQKGLVHAASGLGHPGRAVVGQHMGKKVHHRRHEALFVHDVAAPKAEDAAGPHGGLPPVHDGPQGRGHPVVPGVEAGEAQGLFLIVHADDLRAQPLAHHGREPQAAAQVQAGAPGDLGAALFQPAAQGDAGRPQFRPVGQAFVLEVLRIVQHGVPQALQVGGALQAPQTAAGPHGDAGGVGREAVAFLPGSGSGPCRRRFRPAAAGRPVLFRHVSLSRIHPASIAYRAPSVQPDGLCPAPPFAMLRPYLHERTRPAAGRRKLRRPATVPPRRPQEDLFLTGSLWDRIFLTSSSCWS